jgi:hypothetical protein
MELPLQIDHRQLNYLVCLSKHRRKRDEDEEEAFRKRANRQRLVKETLDQI